MVRERTPPNKENEEVERRRLPVAGVRITIKIVVSAMVSPRLGIWVVGALWIWRTLIWGGEEVCPSGNQGRNRRRGRAWRGLGRSAAVSSLVIFLYKCNSRGRQVMVMRLLVVRYYF